MGRQFANATAVLQLLLALLAQGAVPHLHGPEADPSATDELIVAAGQTDAPTAAAFEAAECVACRSGQSSRVAIAAGGLTQPVVAGDERCALPRHAEPSPASRIACAASPPRAPPATV